MKNEDFVNGVNIIAEYLNQGGDDFWAEWGVVFFGKSDLPISDEDVKSLEMLEWRKSNGYWSFIIS